MRRILICAILSLFSIYVFSQNNSEAVIMMFYNVENLFDTINDPHTLDDDFTPEGKKKWTSSRYEKKINDTDTLHVFVNHWKSRIGGQEETEPQRIECALVLRKVVDSLFIVNKNAKVLIMGDLNDEPTNKSVFCNT